MQSTIVEIFDANGRKMMEQNIPKRSITAEIDVRSLKCGVYFCKFSTDKETVIKKPYNAKDEPIYHFECSLAKREIPRRFAPPGMINMNKMLWKSATAPLAFFADTDQAVEIFHFNIFAVHFNQAVFTKLFDHPDNRFRAHTRQFSEVFSGKWQFKFGLFKNLS